MAKVRSAPHPSAGRSLSPPQAAGRTGRRRRPRFAGRRRDTTSPFALVVTLIFRRETLGAALVILATLAVPWLVPFSKGASSIRDDLVQAVGLCVFLIIGILGTLGWLVLRRSLRSALAQWQWWVAGGLGAVFLLGYLGLFRPDWELGRVSLSEVTAGGDLGHALTSTGMGILIWLACGAGAVVVRWPRTSRHALARSPHAAVVVWRWRVPQRVWKGLHAVLQAIFPTRVAPTPQPRVPVDTLMWARTASATLPAEPEATAPPAPTEEAGTPSDFGWQTELPLSGQEDAAAAAAPPLPAAAHLREAEGGWMLPPLELLTAVAPQEDVRPDNAARAQLIMDTFASFGVDARVAQINEGPPSPNSASSPGGR